VSHGTRHRLGRIFDIRRSPRLVFAMVIVIAQFGICAWYHLGETRYFAWAPNDYVVTYDLRVTVGGRPLSKEEISDRYRLDLGELSNFDADVKAKLDLSPAERYVWQDPPQHLFDRIKGYEQEYSARPARVRLLYQVAGGKEREWRWPS
jgi:hypothetical protein